MANIKDLIQSIESSDSSFDEKLAAINEMEETLVAMRSQEQEAIDDNVSLIVEAIKVMERKVEAQLEAAKAIVPEKGDKGEPGKEGRDGQPGRDGQDGRDGQNGNDGRDGADGVSVTDAKIDFDGSLVITLSTGREINVGEVVAPDLAEKIKVISTMSTNTAIADITGGSINGTTIGSTTPAAGTFTTLTATGQTDIGGSSALTMRFTQATSTVMRAAAVGASVAEIRWSVPSFHTFYTGSNATLSLEGAAQFRVNHTASAVNFVQVTGAATSPGASALANILFTGSDAGVNAAIITKGTGYIAFAGNSSTSNQAFRINTTNATNTGVLLQVQGAVSGNTPVVSAISGSSNSDANIPVTFQSKGTGAINLAPGSSGVNISNGGTVTAITRTAAGSGYTSLPAIAVSAPTTAGGVTATATASGLALVGSTAVVSGGTGYTVGDTLTLAGFTGTAPTFTVTTVSAGVVTAITAVSGGNFTAAPASPASVTGGTGTGATISFSAGVLATFTITNAGSGYVEQPTVTFSGGGGSGAAAFATIGSATSLKSLSDMTVNLPSGPVLSMTDSSLPGSGAYLNLSNGSSSNAIQRAAGTATNIGVFWLSKGTSGHSFSTNNSTATEQFRVTHTASAVNYVQVTGAATGSAGTISSQGSDTNINMSFVSKGNAGFRFFSQSGGARQFQINNTTSAVNYALVTGAVAGAGPVYSVEGSDTNIDLALTPKGTGNVRFGTYTASMALTVQGYVEIKTADGVVRKLAVIA